MRNITILSTLFLATFSAHAFVPSHRISHRRISPPSSALFSTQTDRDFYEILGISRYASPQEIKSAYRRLVKLCHPDVNPHPGAVEQFHNVYNAYEVLMDPHLKHKYDTKMFSTSKRGPGGFRQVGPPPYGSFLNTNAVHKDWSETTHPHADSASSYDTMDPYGRNNYMHNNGNVYPQENPAHNNGYRQVGPPPYGSFLNEKGVKGWTGTPITDPDFSPYNGAPPPPYTQDSNAYIDSNGYDGSFGNGDYGGGPQDYYDDRFVADSFNNGYNDNAPPFTDYTENGVRQVGPPPFGSFLNNGADWADGYTSSQGAGINNNGYYNGVESHVQQENAYPPSGYNDPNVKFRHGRAVPFGSGFGEVVEDAVIETNVHNGFYNGELSGNGDAYHHEATSSTPLNDGSYDTNVKQQNGGKVPFRSGLGHDKNDGFISNGFAVNAEPEEGVQYDTVDGSVGDEPFKSDGFISNGFAVNEEPEEGVQYDTVDGSVGDEPFNTTAKRRIRENRTPFNGFGPQAIGNNYENVAPPTKEVWYSGSHHHDSSEVQQEEATMTEPEDARVSAYEYPYQQTDNAQYYPGTTASYNAHNDVVQDYDTTEPFGSGSGYNDPNLRRKFVRAMYEQYNATLNDGGGISESIYSGTNGFHDPNVTHDYYSRASQSPGPAAFGQQIDFGHAFGGFRSMNGRPAPIVGEDLQIDLEIDLKKAIFGGNETVLIQHLETCEQCNGKGVETSTCGLCNGLGVLYEKKQALHGRSHTEKKCPDCLGTGELVGGDCYACNKQGLFERTKNVTVCIPAGVEGYTRLRVRGEGDAGPNGGPSGDLYVFLTIIEHPTSRRKGLEIHSEADIDIIDALLGTVIDCPLVDGKVPLEVHAGTQHGEEVRLEGSGAFKLGEPEVRGDHCVTMNVEIPTDLSSEEEAIVKRLKELQGTPPKSKKKKNEEKKTKGGGGMPFFGKEA